MFETAPAGLDCSRAGRSLDAASPLQRHPGLVCPACGGRRFTTVYTRRRNLGIVRRKRCRACGKAITTRETLA